MTERVEKHLICARQLGGYNFSLVILLLFFPADQGKTFALGFLRAAEAGARGRG